MLTPNRILVLPLDGDGDHSSLRWPPKLPGAVLDHSLDFTAWAICADTVFISSTVRATSGLSVLGRSYGSFGNQTTRINLELGRGNPGTDEQVVLELTFDNGRVLEVTIALLILALPTDLVTIDFGRAGAVTIDGDVVSIGGDPVEIGDGNSGVVMLNATIGGDPVTIGGNPVEI